MVNGVSTLPVPNCPPGVSSAPSAQALAPALTQAGFVAGDENRLLAAVLQAWCRVLDQDQRSVATDAWNRLTSPLVLVGPTGSGKSHLATGLVSLAGDHRACCASANDLRHEFADAVKAGEAAAWRERLAAVPLLVIDDLDHLPPRGQFQYELLYLLQEREQRGHKFIATSAQPIAHLDGWLADLVNWFASGLTVQIAPLGSTAREAVMSQIVEANGWQFTPEAFEALIEQTPAEPRELFRLATDLERQFGRQARFEVDTLTHYLNKRKTDHAPALRDIVRVVARYYQVPLKTLTSASRQAAVVGARATAIYLARTLTDASYEQIGRQLGGRDHSTIMHSFRQTEKRLARETALRSAIDELSRLLRK